MEKLNKSTAEDSVNNCQGVSGINNISNLIKLHKNQYEKSNPKDKRWPCPFCFNKSKTKIQCIIHIKKRHPSIFKADKKLLAEFAYVDKVESQSNEPKKNESKITFKNCMYCPEELSQKQYASEKGLKIYYSRKHKDILETISQDILNSTNVQSQLPTLEKQDGMVECDFCPGKFFQIPNGIKIHKARCKGTIANIENNSNLDEFLELLTKYKMETKVVKRIPNGARKCVAQKLTSVVNTCLAENSVLSWQNLFLFPYRNLSVPEKKKKNEKNSLIHRK